MGSDPVSAGARDGRVKRHRHASPNCGCRRGGALPDLVVLHYTAMDSAGAALERLCDPAAQVSAHYLVGRNGEVWYLVDERMRAWHAGAGSWGAVGDVNSRSIGIELDNRGGEPFTEPQMEALEALLPEIMARWTIPAERVIAHSDMAPARKTDPGARFDWWRLALCGLSVWPQSEARPQGRDERAFARACRRFGYPDTDPGTCLAAFRLRFRPWATGPLDPADIAAIENLAFRFPVDRRDATA